MNEITESPESITKVESIPFVVALERLINRYSMESQSDTPDFILAEFILGCLATFANTAKKRDEWYGFTPFEDVLKDPKGIGVLKSDCEMKF